MSAVKRRHRHAWPLLSLIGLSLAGSLGQRPTEAQQEQEPSTFQEVLDVNLVNVDIVVVDKKGALVTDLTLDDFQITDDGKKVKVEYFARLGEGGVPGDAEPGSDSGARPASGAEGASSELQRLVVLVDLDSEQLLNRNRVLDDVMEYLEAHPTAVTAMIVTYGSSGLQIKLPFSTTP